MAERLTLTGFADWQCDFERTVRLTFLKGQYFPRLWCCERLAQWPSISDRRETHSALLEAPRRFGGMRTTAGVESNSLERLPWLVQMS